MRRLISCVPNGRLPHRQIDGCLESLGCVVVQRTAPASPPAVLRWSPTESPTFAAKFSPTSSPSLTTRASFKLKSYGSLASSSSASLTSRVSSPSSVPLRTRVSPASSASLASEVSLTSSVSTPSPVSVTSKVSSPSSVSYPILAIFRSLVTSRAISCQLITTSTIASNSVHFKCPFSSSSSSPQPTESSSASFQELGPAAPFPTFQQPKRNENFKKVDDNDLRILASFLKRPSSQLLVSYNERASSRASLAPSTTTSPTLPPTASPTPPPSPPSMSSMESSKSSIPYQVLQGSELITFREDWSGKYKSKDVEDSRNVVIFPSCVDEIQRILKYCSEKKIAVCPQGGNTGLVGGSVPVFDEIVINLRKMNKINYYDDQNGLVDADAGVVLGDLHNFLQSPASHLSMLSSAALASLQRRGSCPSASPSTSSQKSSSSTQASSLSSSETLPLSTSQVSSLVSSLSASSPPRIAPIDLGSKGSCMIGGLINTNAGGIRFNRYGSLNGNVIGLEFVTGNGEKIDLLNYMKKNNEGVKLHQLLIGSEGSYGIVTRVVLQTPLSPTNTNVVIIKVKKSMNNVINVTQKIKSHLNEIISAVEFLDNATMIQVIKSFPTILYPFISTSRTNHFQNDQRQHEQQQHNPFNDNFLGNGDGKSSGNSDKMRTNIRKLKDTDFHYKIDQVEKEVNARGFYVLFETHGFCEESDKMRVENFLCNLIGENESDATADTFHEDHGGEPDTNRALNGDDESDLSIKASDVVMAVNGSQQKDLWFFRENAATSGNHQGRVLKFDLTAPLELMYLPVVMMRKRLMKYLPIIDEIGAIRRRVKSEGRSDEDADAQIQSLIRANLVDKNEIGNASDAARAVNATYTGTGSENVDCSTDNCGEDDDDESLILGRNGIIDEEIGGIMSYADDDDDADIDDRGVDVLAMGYGHIGDCNIHLNIVIRDKSKTTNLTKADDATKNHDGGKHDTVGVSSGGVRGDSDVIDVVHERRRVEKRLRKVKRIVDPWIYKLVKKYMRGSISSEHGVGLEKRHLFEFFLSGEEEKKTIHKTIKHLFDKNGIMNPYKLGSFD